jgi:transcription-repair coupling factor (superfamily II helicase)
LRLILYKRIANAINNEELDELRVEFIDRFGLLPDATKNLFRVTEIKLMAEQAGIQKIDVNDSGIRILFMANPNINPENLIKLIQSKPADYKFDGTDTLRISQQSEDNTDSATIITELINKLSIREAA